MPAGTGAWAQPQAKSCSFSPAVKESLTMAAWSDPWRHEINRRNYAGLRTLIAWLFNRAQLPLSPLHKMFLLVFDPAVRKPSGIERHYQPRRMR